MLHYHPKCNRRREHTETRGNTNRLANEGYASKFCAVMFGSRRRSCIAILNHNISRPDPYKYAGKL